jgi:RHS repeat-associated protein
VLEYDGLTGTLLRWYADGLGPNAVISQGQRGYARHADPQSARLDCGLLRFDRGAHQVRLSALWFGSAAPQFAYTGQRIDPETGGPYYYRSRHYSTAFGRFLQSDPVGYSESMNLYGYVSNDPLNAADPTGLTSEYAGGVGFASPWANDSNLLSGSSWGSPRAASAFPAFAAPITRPPSAAPGGSDQTVVFGTNPQAFGHALRHVEAIGLNKSQIMQAIQADLQPRLPLASSQNNAPFNGSVTVNGVTLNYSAYQRLVNVGRITPQ